MMDFDNAANYWRQQDALDIKADTETVRAQAEKFIHSHNTCALATGFGADVRCTPIEYTYLEGCFWLLSEGGEKFRNLKNNKRVSLAIYDAYKGFNDLGGMQITGEARLIEPWSAEYLALLKFKNISPAALRKLDHPMYLIQITPLSIEFLSSGFKQLGVAARQRIEYP